MKKLLIIMSLLLLVGCKAPPKQVVAKVPEKKVEIELEDKVDYIEYDVLKEMILLANKKTEIIDIEYLHDRLSKVLLSQVDLGLSIDGQADLIDDIIRAELYQWKTEMVREMLIEESIVLNEDDFDTLVKKTSIKDAYQVMSIYETIYLKKEAE